MDVMDVMELASKPLGFDVRSNPSPRAAVGGVLGDAVAVAYVHSESVSASWSKSMLDLVSFDVANSQRVFRGGLFDIQYGADGLVDARNRGVVQSLKQRQADWLLWLDTDMGFAPDTVDRLLSSADPVEAPIVGGLCFAAKYEMPDGLGGWHIKTHPTIYDWVQFQDDSQGFKPNWDYPGNELVKCDGTGSACVLIHRSVFEKIGTGWYDRVTSESSGRLLSEDLSFFMKVNQAGFPVFVDTSVKTSHAKTVWVGEEFYRGQQALQVKSG